MGKAEAVRLALNAANLLLKVAFAPHCAACAAPLDSPADTCICPQCWLQADSTSGSSWSSELVSIARAGGDYDRALRDIVHAFKYEPLRSLARPLAERMVDRGGDVLEGTACLVPVPLHPWRRVRRGFNQAAELARHVSHAAVLRRADNWPSRSPLPVVPALWRARLTRTQTGLTAAARHRNVRHAFIPSPLLRDAVRGDLIAGRIVVLVDDVRTTGATLNACARVLLDAGAAEVRALTAAARDLR